MRRPWGPLALADLSPGFRTSLIPDLRDSSSLVLVVVLVVVADFLLSCLAREVGGTLGASLARPWQFMPHRTLLVWSKEIEDEDDDDSDRESALPNIGGYARRAPGPYSVSR